MSAFKTAALYLLPLTLVASAARAQSAADALLNAAGPKAAADVTNAPANAVARELAIAWNNGSGKSGSASFETGTWVRFFLNEKYEAAAHLWTAISKKMPDHLADNAKAAQLYSLYRLGLNQTFFDQWTASLSSPRFAQSRGALALEESLAPGFEAWYLDHAIQLTPDAVATIRKLGPDRSSVLTSLYAATYLRQGEAAADALAKLPTESRFRAPLAETIAVALARKNDLAGAGRILKAHYEPTLKDPAKVSAHYLQIARLLYQAGAFEGAVGYYEKIPTGSPQYLTAREELAWCWLRLGDASKLRGNLKTLTSNALADRFQPEAYLVRAISNLKLCYHDEVAKDFDTFLGANKPWAAKIQENLKASDPAAPRVTDEFALRAVKAEQERQAELPILEGLSQRSIAAVLPAVGPQKHWVDALQRAKLDLEEARKQRVSEYRRQWRADQGALIEAIRKMQFVKVELMSQVAMLAASEKATSESSKLALANATGGSPDAVAMKAKIRNDGDMVFPFDGVVWPDELFKLRSQATSRCLDRL